MNYQSCPKCKGNRAWFEIDHADLILRCLCGARQFVASRHKPLVIDPEDMIDEIKLPQSGTHLWSTLMVLFVLEPATSAEITQRLTDFGQRAYSVSDVSSYLTILRSKGLVLTMDFRRGIIGGSTWRCTDEALRLIPPNGVGYDKDPTEFHRQRLGFGTQVPLPVGA